MKQVDRSELLSLGDYEAIRVPFRNRIIAEKQRRRVLIGDKMSVVFENHDTVLLQVQEMLRTERITKRAAVDYELATYNEMVPGEDELSMTLFIEIVDKPEREHMLTQLAGMESNVFIELDGKRVAAKASERDGADPARTTAVQYYKIPLPAEVAEALRAGRVERASLIVDHPAYPQQVALGRAVIAELAADLVD